ncbi:hypothetical protein PIB30_051853 [Stylosanthes scabra]|uniref:Transposase-associated domain-containing protein n=1 Tax=Stylosanthes scabra TaxID=79078 RepID=A0ABU6RI69_9FABA|nr:hypothetical protein [Stylosanthes scabra]
MKRNVALMNTPLVKQKNTNCLQQRNTPFFSPISAEPKTLPRPPLSPPPPPPFLNFSLLRAPFDIPSPALDSWFGKVRFPCAKCKCTKFKNIDEVRVDLLRKGFMTNYLTWVQHGENNLEDLISKYVLGAYNASYEEPVMNHWNENMVRYESMVVDAFPQFETFDVNE